MFTQHSRGVVDRFYFSNKTIFSFRVLLLLQAPPTEVEALAAIRHINGVVLTTAGIHHPEKKVYRSVNQLLLDDGVQERRKLEQKIGSGVTVAKDQATATPKPPTTSLGDIFISVKTTKKNHDNRLELILNTWHQMAKHQVSRFNK